MMVSELVEFLKDLDQTADITIVAPGQDFKILDVDENDIGVAIYVGDEE